MMARMEFDSSPTAQRKQKELWKNWLYVITENIEKIDVIDVQRKDRIKIENC